MRAALVLALAAGVLAPAPTTAQTADERRIEMEVAAAALQSQLGLMAGLGSEVPGSAGTLGRRLGATPRIAVSIRAGFMQGGLPDLADPAGPPSRALDYTLPSVVGGVAVGLYDGFSALPTLGGILSVDALGSMALVFPPTSEGFDGKVTAASLGLRIGLLRESFSVPGVAVSFTQRWLGESTFGEPTDPARPMIAVDPRVTAVRATVGKDLLSLGLLGGVGWDFYRGDYVGTWTDEASGQAMQDGGELSRSRRLLFGGASMNFLILQLSAELGWADGFDPVPGYLGAPFDATEGDLFGSLAFRLTI